jgi:peptide subunit release factor 1 (eRF1)
MKAPTVGIRVGRRHVKCPVCEYRTHLTAGELTQSVIDCADCEEPLINPHYIAEDREEI